MKRTILALSIALFAPLTAAAEPPELSPPDLADGLAAGSAAAAHLDPKLLTAIGLRVQDNTFQKITSVVVLMDGKLAYEGYFNGAGRDTQHDIRSASKTVTSILIGQAIASASWKRACEKRLGRGSGLFSGLSAVKLKAENRLPGGRNLPSLGCQPQVGRPPKSPSPAGPAWLS